MKSTTWVILGVLACMSTPFAVKPASAEKVDARQELDRLEIPLGDMHCMGNLMATPKEPGHATAASLHIEKVLDGHWIALHYDEERTAQNPNPYHVVQYIGYDEPNKRFASVVLDDSGAGATLGSSPGLNGNVMVVDETVTSGEYRDTFTKSADGLMHTGTMLDKDKKWIKTDEETCRRSAQ